MEKIYHLTEKEYKSLMIDREKELEKIKFDYKIENYKFDWGHFAVVGLVYCFYKLTYLTEGVFNWWVCFLLSVITVFIFIQLYFLYKNLKVMQNGN